MLGLFDKVLDIKATSGSASLGGEDIDVEIQEKFLSKILCQVEQKKVREAAGELVKNIRADPSASATIRAECKLTKDSLSNSDFAVIRIARLFSEFDLEFELTGSMLAGLSADFLDDTYEYMDRSMQDASLSTVEIMMLYSWVAARIKENCKAI